MTGKIFNNGAGIALVLLQLYFTSCLSNGFSSNPNVLLKEKLSKFKDCDIQIASNFSLQTLIVGDEKN